MEWLVDLRKEKRMSQSEVAAKAKISQSHYAAIENEDRRPSVTTAKAIAGVLGFLWTRFYDDAAPADEAESA
jgi:transcriptional regulator with XRE-family HTH domain